MTGVCGGYRESGTGAARSEKCDEGEEREAREEPAGTFDPLQSAGRSSSANKKSPRLKSAPISPRSVRVFPD